MGRGLRNDMNNDELGGDMNNGGVYMHMASNNVDDMLGTIVILQILHCSLYIRRTSQILRLRQILHCCIVLSPPIGTRRATSKISEMVRSSFEVIYIIRITCPLN